MITISPRWSGQEVSVVIASDAHYIPYMAVTVKSIIEYSTPENKYDIIILADAESAEEEASLKSMCAGMEHISIRCIDMSSFRQMCESFGVRNHLSLAAYYRLYIASICAAYDKVIYLDCDVLCHADIAELYHMNLGTNLVAAAYDRPIQDVHNEWLVGARAYIESIGMKDAKKCFNSGVMLMNLTQMRQENTQQEFLRVAAINKKYWHDQSVLNICCQERVLFFPESWNYTTHMYSLSELSPRSVKERQELMQDESYHIIHYAGGAKPWKTFTSPLYRQWWEVAARTPYYDIIRRRTKKSVLARLSAKQIFMLSLALLRAAIMPVKENRTMAWQQLAGVGGAVLDMRRWLLLWRSLKG